jgi:hypothetical protein
MSCVSYRKAVDLRRAQRKCRANARSGYVARPRRDWIRGEVRCITCARLVGRQLGSSRGKTGQTARQDALSFFAYKSSELDSLVVSYVRGMRLRCAKRGGAGALDDPHIITKSFTNGTALVAAPMAWLLASLVHQLAAARVGPDS